MDTQLHRTIHTWAVLLIDGTQARAGIKARDVGPPHSQLGIRPRRLFPQGSHRSTTWMAEACGQQRRVRLREACEEEEIRHIDAPVAAAHTWFDSVLMGENRAGRGQCRFSRRPSSSSTVRGRRLSSPTGMSGPCIQHQQPVALTNSVTYHLLMMCHTNPIVLVVHVENKVMLSDFQWYPSICNQGWGLPEKEKI